MSKTTKPREEWRRLSSEDFVKALQGKSLRGNNGRGISFLEKDEYGNNYVAVKDVIVKDPIELVADEMYQFPIWVKNVEFQRGFEISAGNFQGSFQVYSGVFQEYFIISGGDFQENFIISGGDFQGYFKILDGNFQKHFWISGGSIGIFQISGGNIQGHFGIESGDFQGFLEVSGGNFQKKLKIEGGHFKGRFRVSGGYFDDYFEVSDGCFEEHFKIDGGNFQKKLKIYGGDFYGGFKIFGGDFKGISIRNHNGYFSVIELRIVINHVLRIQNTKANELLLVGTLSDGGRLYLKNITLNRFAIKDFINESLISADRIIASEAIHKRIEDKDWNGKEKMWKTKVEHKPPVMVLESSDLGETTFFDTAFEAFNKITIKSLRFTGVKTTDGHFPLALGKKKQVVTGEENAQDPVTLEETYNQLYLAMKNSGNRTWEMRYYAEYMEWHRKRLIKEGKEPFTRFTLWLNKHTNSYNRNWFRAVLLTMLVTFVFYMGYYLSIWGWDFQWNNLSWSSFFYHCDNYMQFMLPTHKFNFIESESVKLGTASIFIDALSRIAIGYMLYQTISAFRRFGRR